MVDLTEPGYRPSRTSVHRLRHMLKDFFNGAAGAGAGLERGAAVMLVLALQYLEESRPSSISG
jgi:hypothetical protein